MSSQVERVLWNSVFVLLHGRTDGLFVRHVHVHCLPGTLCRSYMYVLSANGSMFGFRSDISSYGTRIKGVHVS